MQHTITWFNYANLTVQFTEGQRRDGQCDGRFEHWNLRPCTLRSVVQNWKVSYTFSILKIELIYFVLFIQQAIGRAALVEDLQRGDEYIELFIEYYYNIEYRKEYRILLYYYYYIIIYRIFLEFFMYRIRFLTSCKYETSTVKVVQPRPMLCKSPKNEGQRRWNYFRWQITDLFTCPRKGSLLKVDSVL